MKQFDKKRIILIGLSLLVIITMTIGVSFAFFNYIKEGTKQNTIKTANITFVYDEKEKQGNGILLSNQFPISDTEGKALNSTNELFNFKIYGKTTGASLNYEVLIKKDESSTLDENAVKVYLTKTNGVTEEEMILKTFNTLKETTLPDAMGKVLISEIIRKSNTDYNQEYNLRMWISNTAVSDGEEWIHNNKIFSVKINVMAVSLDNITKDIGEGIVLTESAKGSTMNMNTTPISNDLGKVLTNPNNIYDFSLNTETKEDTKKIEITLDMDISSTITEEQKKNLMIYLTKVNEGGLALDLSKTKIQTVSSNEQEVVLLKYSDLETKEDGKKVLYTEIIEEDAKYKTSYRVRSFISSENLTDEQIEALKKETVSLKVNIIGKFGIYIDQSGASRAELHDNMIPVKYNGTNWVTANLSEKWYDYDTQEWANAIVVDKSEYNTYKKERTIIPENKILLMYVWIPRYEYTIYKGTNGSNLYSGGTQNSPGMIDINFVNNKTDKVFETAKYSSVSQGTNVSGYRTHDAFTFGDTELNGIWVGKFEVTGTLTETCTNETCNVDNISIRPNQSSFRNQTPAGFFFALRSFEQPNNKFGFTNNVNSHMMKNSEWGAVAYLSQSKYGKAGNSKFVGSNKEVAINPSDSFTTGRSGTIVSSSSISDSNNETSTSLYGYDGRSCSSKTGFVCTGVKSDVHGVSASTTGTIYGIYDMSGGSWEYLMGWTSMASNIFGGDSPTTNNSGFMADPGSKYWNNYTTTTPTTACNGGVCYGEGISETSGWYRDSAYFFNSSLPWISRSGGYRENSSAGIFYAHYVSGRANTLYSSRAVLTTK